jgi:transposase
MSDKYTIHDLTEQFPDEDACLEWLKNTRWPNGIHCEKCKCVTKHHRISGRKVYSCQFCGNQVSPCADTIFHGSSAPLRSWFYAMFLMSVTRCGISAKQLQREIGVTYKTAWRMFHQIRKLMAEDISTLTEALEVDESYFGGKRHGKRGGGAAGKAVVMGMAKRKGKIIAKVTPDVKARTLLPNIRKHVMPSSTIFTDELASYNGLAKAGYRHHRVHHSARVYVSGTAHTNTIEGFWSLVKRGIDGVHHLVSHKYLQSYLNSYAYRWNHRDDGTAMFTLLLNRIPALCGGSAVPPS